MHTEDQLSWVESTGGPLILIDSKLALEWCGTSGNSGPPESSSDYERACSIDGYLGGLAVQNGQAMILGDEPMRTSVKRIESNEVLIVRWGWAPSETQLIQTLQSAMKSTNWLDNDLAITHASGSFVIFDSSEEFAEVKSMIEFSLTAGVIRIRTLEFKPNDSIFLVLHRIMSIEP